MFGANNLDVIARRALLDALEVLQPHLESLILIGAQAVYLHTNHFELPLAPATTDADLVFDTRILAVNPELGDLLKSTGYQLSSDSAKNPGHWVSKEGIPLDLFQPAALSGRSKSARGAHIYPHQKNLLRITVGLNCALVDNAAMEIASFSSDDQRSFEIKVAGPTALLVAKTAKIFDRKNNTDSRLAHKDAHDVYRLLKGVETHTLTESWKTLLVDELSGHEASEGLTNFKEFFAASQEAIGNQMAVQAAGLTENPDQLRASLWALALDLVEAIEA